MKHIFKRALALTMTTALFAVSAFAAPAPEYSSVSYDKTTGVLTATVSGYEQGKDATILILKKGAELATAGSDDIIYINQIDGADIGADGTYTFTAPIKERAADKSATEVNLYVGGADVPAAKVYTKAGDTGATDIDLSDGGDTPEVSYAASVPADTTYKTIEDAIAALVVTKTEGATTTTLTSSDYTVEKVQDTTDTTKYTLIIKIGGAEVATTTVTITPDTPTPGTKTGVTGVVKSQKGFSKAYTEDNGAVVYVTNGATIVGSFVTGTDGKFEIEVPAGTYRIIARFANITATGVTNYANQIITDVVVNEGALTTVTSAGNEFLAVEKRTPGDADDNGTINSNDLSAVVTALSGLK